MTLVLLYSKVLMKSGKISRLHSLAELPAESSTVGLSGELFHDASTKIHDGEVCQQVGQSKLHNSQGEKVEQVEE